MQTFTIKQGDTAPAIQATLTGANGSAQDLTGATVAFSMRKGSAPAVVDRGACTIIGSPTAGVASYQWEAGDTAVAGVYTADFKVTFDDSRTQSFPNDSSIQVTITKAVVA